MPRRRRHGLSHSKKIIARKKEAIPAKKETTIKSGGSGEGNSDLDSVGNHLPSLGSEQAYLQSENKGSTTSDTSYISGKYLHKKFKKVATAYPIVEKDSVYEGVNSFSENFFHDESENLSLNRKIPHSYVKCEYGAMLPDIQVKQEVETDYYEKNCLNEETYTIANSSSILVCNSVTDPSQFAVAQLQERNMCPYCKLTCAKPSVLQKHICAHTNERCFPCLPCGFAFKTRSNLYKHCQSLSHAQEISGEEEGESGFRAYHKYICTLLESSDAEKENDIVYTNPPLSSYSTTHDTSAASSLPSSYTYSDNISFLPSDPCQTDNCQDKSRRIYKPKFHKDTFHEMTDEGTKKLSETTLSGLQHVAINASSPPFLSHLNLHRPDFEVFSPLKFHLPDFQVTCLSPLSGYLQWQLNWSSNESKKYTNVGNLTLAQTSLQNPTFREHEKESPKGSLCSSSFPLVSYDYLSCSRIAVDDSSISSAVARESNISGCHFIDEHCMQVGGNISSQNCSFLEFMQPLNLTTHKRKDSQASDNTLISRKRSYSEDYPTTSNVRDQKSCEETTVHDKSSAKIAKFKKVEHITPYECRQESSVCEILYNSENIDDCIVKDIFNKEPKIKKGAEYPTSLGTFFSDKDSPPRTLDPDGTLFSQFVTSTPDELHHPFMLYNDDFKTFDAFDVHQCLRCRQEYRYCGCSYGSSNQTVKCGPQNKYLIPLSLEENRNFFALSLNDEPETHKLSEKLQALSQLPAKKISSPFPLNENHKSSSFVLPSFPSPGPLLGNTPLIEGYQIYKNTKDFEENTNYFEEEPRGMYKIKRRKIQSDICSRETNSSASELKTLPLTTPSNTSSPVSTLPLEEITKNSVRSNSLQMFGGEVQILDSDGAKKTLRIEPSLCRNKLAVSSASASDLVPKLPSNFNNKSDENENFGNKTESISPQMVVTIAKSGLNSGGTIVQVPRNSTSEIAFSMLSSNVMKTHNNSTNDKISQEVFCLNSQTTPSLEKHLQKNSAIRDDIKSSSLQYACATSLYNETHPDTTKLLLPIAPNISTPDLAVPGIPPPIFGNHLPFISFSTVLKDRPLVNPLTNITAYNPLTLQAHSALFHSVPHNAYSTGTKQTTAENKTQCSICSYTAVQQEHFWPPCPGYAENIINKGKHFPYVPGIQSTNCSVPMKMAYVSESSLEPLDLAIPSKDVNNESFLPTYQSKSCKSETVKTLTVDTRITNVNFQQSSLDVESNMELRQKCDIEPYTNILEDHNSLLPLKHTNHATVSHDPEYKRQPAKSLPVSCEDTSTIQGKVVENAENKIQFDKGKKLPKCAILYEGHESDFTKNDRNNKHYSFCWASEKENDKVELKYESLKREEITSVVAKLCRPTSLPLYPEIGVTKRSVRNGATDVGVVLPLISPETPRPKKSYGQLYMNGYVFTFLTLKISTKPFFCILTRTQPMYTLQSPENPKLSMYSNWKIKDKLSPNPLGLSTSVALSLYDSRNRSTMYTTAKPKDEQPMLFTHSSYWFEREHLQKFMDKNTEENGQELSDTAKNIPYVNIPVLEATSSELAATRLKIVNDESESKEDNTHVEDKVSTEDDGGRGRYVCEECGIHFKKSSRYRRHIREHTNVSPYSCKFCDLSFKTKGKLKKHRKSMMHYTKFVKFKVLPAPNVMDVTYGDEEESGKQSADQNGEFNDMVSDENYEEVGDRYKDVDEHNDDDTTCKVTEDCGSTMEHEAARSLLSLSELTGCCSASKHQSASADLAPGVVYSGRPKTYPYLLAIQDVKISSKGDNTCATPNIRTLTAVNAQEEREKVSQNTGLASEFKSRKGEDKVHSKLSNLLHRRDNAAPLMLILPQRNDYESYYNTPHQKSTISKCKKHSSSKPVKDGHLGTEEEYASEMTWPEYESGICNQKIGFSFQMKDAMPPLDQPIDLSSKNTSNVVHVLKTSPSSDLALFPSFVQKNRTRKSSDPISEMLSPVSEPTTLITSLCSSVEQSPVSTSLLADQPIPRPTNPNQANMLNAYLTECAVQNSRMRLRQCKDLGSVENNVLTSVRTEIPSCQSSLVGITEPITDKQDVENQILQYLQVPVVTYAPQPSKHTELIITNSTAEIRNTYMKQIVSETTDIRISDSITGKKAQNKQLLESSEFREVQTETNNVASVKSPVSQDCKESYTLSIKPENEVRNVIEDLTFNSGSLEHSSPSISTQILSEHVKDLISSSTGSSSLYDSITRDSRRMCNICKKVFSKPSQLRLHANIHYFERPFRCERCAVSFRTTGNLQKHERSVTHQNKVNMNSTFGTPTTTNPRPFKCNDCKIAFRIHGHLAKHLRSKMHITKLECVGKLSLDKN